MIYFAERIDGAIKIGWTEGDPRRRMVGLGAKKEKITLLGVIRGGLSEERAIHKKLQKYRLYPNGYQREWYNPSSAVMLEVDRSAPFEADPLKRPAWQRFAPPRVREFAEKLPGDHLMTSEEVRQILADQVSLCGSEHAFKSSKKIATADTRAVFRGLPPSTRVLTALGLEKVITYRRKATK